MSKSHFAIRRDVLALGKGFFFYLHRDSDKKFAISFRVRNGGDGSLAKINQAQVQPVMTTLCLAAGN